MTIMHQGRYLLIHPRGDKNFNPKLLLGWRQKKNDPWIKAEDNIINRIVLGMPLELHREFKGIRHVENLEEFQINDITKMHSLKNILNANPMGLGKTVETIKFLQDKDAKIVLIVTPKIILNQWKDQLKRWANIDATIYNKQRKVTPGVWLVNYDKLRNESTLVKFKEFVWTYLILDEAHKIKNRNSLQTVAVKNIPALNKIALTGTPITRYVDDLWSILNFLDPMYACNSYHTFVDYFCKKQYTPWGDKIVGLTEDPSKIALLNKLLDEICIRNASVKVTQGKTREVIRVPMSIKQRELYRKEKQLVLDQLPDNCTISNGAVLTIRLMQTTSWPGLFIEGEVGPKFEWILETCKNNPTEKIVVFTVFEKSASALKEYLLSQNIVTQSITGKRKAPENEQARKDFVEGKAQLLVGTIGAMSQGYDGLQKVSHTMIFIDRDWSPEIMKQAEDRLHRMGQNNLVNIYYLECTGSFDQHVGHINRTKADDIRSALNDEE